MTRFLIPFPAAVPLISCVDDPYQDEAVKSEDGKTDSSALGVFLDADVRRQARHRLVVGRQARRSRIAAALHGRPAQRHERGRSHRQGRRSPNIVRRPRSSGKTQITYTREAARRLGQAQRTCRRRSTLKLPLDISYAGQEAFATKYKHDCVDCGAHDVDAGSMFYYFRPNASGCTLAAADVDTVDGHARAEPGADDRQVPRVQQGLGGQHAQRRRDLRQVRRRRDDGERRRHRRVQRVRRRDEDRARDAQPHHGPGDVPSSPGVDAPDIEFNATLPDGKKIKVVALLTDNVRTASSRPAFRARYEALSTRADFIVYNGHAGLGTNVRALAAAGKWVAGPVRRRLHERLRHVRVHRRRAQPRAQGRQPRRHDRLQVHRHRQQRRCRRSSHELADTSMAMFRGLLALRRRRRPTSRSSRNIDSSQLVLVTGEQDNTFTPGGGGTPTPWAGLNDERHASRATPSKTLDDADARGGQLRVRDDRHRRRRPLRPRRQRADD